MEKVSHRDLGLRGTKRIVGELEFKHLKTVSSGSVQKQREGKVFFFLPQNNETFNFYILTRH